uniref:Uncharacterized protein n=1 Tax=Anguilla anguilla TaxID=7936 RepID=A0A0E9U7D9_ANGAN
MTTLIHTTTPHDYTNPHNNTTQPCCPTQIHKFTQQHQRTTPLR